MSNKELFIEKTTGFLYGALNLGYDYDEAWDLLIHSKQGHGILNGEYAYLVHHKGRASAEKADSDIGNSYRRESHIDSDLGTLELLASAVYMAHDEFGIDYEKMFEITPLSRFMETCGDVLGNYDDKLIKTYLM